MTLTPLQRRVLGVLIEKAFTSPDAYPLTINSITAGANQKTTRDPLMSVSDGDVSKAVWELQQYQLAAQAEPDRGARSNRFKHLCEERLGWNPRERAIMAELLLRGPQTTGELRGHASRMVPIESVQYVEELLAELAAKDPPLVRQLPRAAGQSTVRFAHTYYEADEALPTYSVPYVQPGAPAAAVAMHDGPHVPPAGAATADRIRELESRVSALESALDELRREVAPLRSLLH